MLNLFNSPVPVMSDEDRRRGERRRKEIAYQDFRKHTFRVALDAGAISPTLPPDTLDRWLDRMWVVVNKPLDEAKLKEVSHVLK